MTDDHRIPKLEADVSRLRDAFESFRIEMTKEIGSIRASIESVRTSIECVKTSIERAKLWMVVTGAGAILSVWGAALTLARFLKP